ncbi:MAG: hypothetical protein D8M58_21220 [Calditrichaeota bacterium]|nr:MAG: hypothetical protein DWQ03_16935 [Calditrichota bacterium]MBL1207934.1 hypothetical protein [Calditrichota bacterium]NOG47769.1 hypothetical protein [Calditrichota bacterium]
MTKLSIVLIFALIFIGCSSSLDSQEDENTNHKLQITFKNVSSQNLQNLIVADKTIGTLLANSSSGAIAFDNFGFDTGMVDEDISVEVNGEELNNHERGFWCGTEKVTTDSGKYTIKLDINEYGLVIYCENAPTIFDNP